LAVCTKCNTYLKSDNYNTSVLMPCQSCGAYVQANVFPALFKKIMPGETGEKLLTDNEAGCFYHPGKKAETACESCGRFLCSLCDMDLNGQHICPLCLEKGRKKRRIINLENERVLYDRIALSLAVYPLFIFWMTFITAPIVIYIVIRYWKARMSITGSTKIRFIAAFIIAGIQLAGWSSFVYSIIKAA